MFIALWPQEEFSEKVLSHEEWISNFHVVSSAFAFYKLRLKSGCIGVDARTACGSLTWF